MDDSVAKASTISRRLFLGTSIAGIAAWYWLLQRQVPSLRVDHEQPASRTLPIPASEKRIIFLSMAGGPSHIDLFDPKPKLTQMQGEEIPASIRQGQRLAQVSNQESLPLVGSPAPFQNCGQAGTCMSRWLPHLGAMADEIALVRSLHTDAVNHEPAITLLLTGSQRAGRPTCGSWVSYGLGSVNDNLPAYVVLLSGDGGQPITSRYWHNAFLPGHHQGVSFRNSGDAVLYLGNPSGVDDRQRQHQINTLNRLNQLRFNLCHDSELQTRIQSYELAFRMQSSVPELIDLAQEPAHVLRLYGAQPGQPSFANNCLLARRLAERGVRFIHLIHRHWDHHTDLPKHLREQCRITDQPAAALIQDLKRLGLLDSTLVVWAGEFGRTPFCQGKLENGNFGRDHHPRCFSVWMAGGGIKRGITFGKTDDFGYNIVESPVHVHDFNATILHCLGINHETMTFRHQGRDYRLTDTAGRVVHEILA